MTLDRETLDLLREYVQREIEAYIAYTEVDEEGYHVSNRTEQKIADNAFERLVQRCETKEDE